MIEKEKLKNLFMIKKKKKLLKIKYPNDSLRSEMINIRQFS